MKELSNYELCLLIYLCYKKEGKAYRGILPSRQEEYYTTWVELSNAVNSYCKDTIVTVFRSSNEQTVSINKMPSVIIKLENKSLLEKFLDDYSMCFESDTLESETDGINFKTHIIQLQKAINTTKKLNEYYIDETKYIPVILWGLRREYIKIKDMNFTLFPSKEERKRIPLIERKRRKIGHNEFDFNIILDLCKFMEIKVNNNDNINSTDKFTKSDKHLLKLARERLVNANEEITSEDMERIYSDKNKNYKTALNIRISNNVGKINRRFNNVTGKDLIEPRYSPYMTETYDIIATIEDIDIALKSSK